MKRFLALWLMLVLLSWYPVQAARLFDASGKNLSVASAIVSAAPMTVCTWFNSTSATALQTIFSINVTADAGEYFALRFPGTTGLMDWAVRTTAAGFVSARSTATYSANVWTHLCGVEAATNSRFLYVNGAQDGTNTTSRIPAGLDDTRIGRRHSGGAEERFQGRIEHLAVWSVALTAPEIAALANTTHPNRIRPANRVAYVPIWGDHSPEIDLWAARAWTINGSPARAPGAPVGLLTVR